MASSNQLVALLHHLERLGVLSKHTRYIHSLKEYQGDPQYFLDTLLRFLHDSRATLDNMEAMLRENVIDYHELAEEAFKLIGSSASVGASELRDKCHILQLAAQKNSRNSCLQAYTAVKREFVAVQPHLEAIAQLERDIILNGNMP